MNAPDKTIVDRRKTHRNTDVARAVRRTREQLSQRAGNPVFDRELIKIHSGMIRDTAGVMPLCVLVVAAGGLLAGLGSEIIIWALISLTGYACLTYVAFRIDRIEIASIDANLARRAFLFAHFLSGIGWAYLTIIQCEQCKIPLFPTSKASILLIVIALTSLLTNAMRGALVVTFALPVAAFTLLTTNFAVLSVALVNIVLVLSLPFFTYCAAVLNKSALLLMTYQTQNDGLVAEVETAKALSDEARRRAEESNMAKSRFLATMSHELRTPLNAILGFSEVMAKEVLGPIENETYREYAKDIHESGNHLLNLINEILDLSRIEAGKYQLHEEPISLANIVQDCAHLVELKARNKDISIQVDVEPTLARLFADERAVRQIVLNLLSNAIKFSPNGSQIHARVGWTAGAGQYVSVKDNGPGIPAEEIPIVLSAFGQGSIAIKAAEQGTGLGLPIVQGLIAMHGGEFILDSKLRHGTEAIAVFPVSRVMEQLPALPTGTQKRQRPSVKAA